MIRRVVIVLGIVLSAAACNGGSSAPPAFFTGTAQPPQHLYLANDTPTQIIDLTIPITSSSAFVTAITFDRAVSVAVDGDGNLAAGNDPGIIGIFNPPFALTSTPSVTFRNGTAQRNGQMAFTPTGDLWAATAQTRVNFFRRPFTSTSTPVMSLTSPGWDFVNGLALDGAGNLYVANGGAINAIYVLAPPYTGVPVMAIPDPDSRATYHHIALTPAQLFVAIETPATPVGATPGRVDVFNLPITATSTPAFSITNGMDLPRAIGFDASGLLYVGFRGISGQGSIKVYAPPYSGTSAPVATFHTACGLCEFGLAIGK